MNKNAKHTPGPWKITPSIHDSSTFDILDATDTILGTVEKWNGAQETKEEADANARLIAAAPAMLDALKSLIEWESIMGGFDSERWAEARNAIAKATGE